MVSACHFFSFLMSPRRSQWPKHPLSQALEALVTTSPRRQRTAPVDVTSSASAPAVPPTPVALSSDLIDQLVSRVTIEVTKQISSLLPSSPAPGLHHNSPSLTEVPVVDLAGSVAPTSQANAVVQDVIQQTHVALTGEPGGTPCAK